MRSGISLLALSVGALALGACGSSGPAKVDVTLAEWSVTPVPVKVPAGDVVFTARNAGTQPHEMLVLRSDVAADALPVENGEIDESAIEALGEVSETPVGESGTLELKGLQAGHYILFCNIAGHYQQGMHADLTVE